MRLLSCIWAMMTDFLHPALEEELGPLTERQRQFVSVCELARLDRHMAPFRGHRLGRKKKPRLDFAKAFVAKAVYNLPTTAALVDYLKADATLRRLCGWERADQVPSEPTFSRAFAEFAQWDMGGQTLEAMVKEQRQGKLAGHISRDATAIKAREKAAKKPKADVTPASKRKRGRPKKGQVVEPKPPKRLALQAARSVQENLADLPTACDWGCKRNSQGKVEWWKGYRARIDTIDGDIPISVVVTSASLHDSQVAIPLAQLSAGRVTNLYDLMDSAYDATAIGDFSRGLGHVAIIDRNPRNVEAVAMDPATARRYDERSSSERVNSTLKDNHGGNNVRVRGVRKVALHLTFGLIAICATQLLRLLE